MDAADESGKREESEKIARDVIGEARMVLPGIQTLFGFQLIAIFNERFRLLSEDEQTIHFTALVLIALAIGIIMTPAAYHRLAEEHIVSDFFIRLGSWLVAAAMVPLMIALTLEVYLLGRMVLGLQSLAGVVAAVVFAMVAGLWFALPLAMRRRYK